VNNMMRAYVRSLSPTKRVSQRINQVVDLYEKLCPEKVSVLFLSEYVTKEGVREFESLWLFSDHIMMEAKNFLSEDDLDFATMVGGVSYVEFTKHEYDFDAPTDASRLSVELRLHSGVMGRLKASGENCRNLADILTGRLLPGMLP
jgi:hypothetical protein